MESKLSIAAGTPDRAEVLRKNVHLEGSAI